MRDFLNPYDIFEIEAKTASGVELKKPISLINPEQKSNFKSTSDVETQPQIDIVSAMVLTQIIANSNL